MYQPNATVPVTASSLRERFQLEALLTGILRELAPRAELAGLTLAQADFRNRFGAIVLIVTGLLHVWYVLATRRGREELWAIAPSLRRPHRPHHRS